MTDHAEELERVGLDPIPPAELVRVVYEGGVRLVVRFQVGGVNGEAELDPDRALALAEDLVRAARLMARG